MLTIVKEKYSNTNKLKSKNIYDRIMFNKGYIILFII